MSSINVEQSFDYLLPNQIYLDSACQSLRPRPVIEALNNYYTAHNSCGERARYPWAKTTDELVADTRAKVLKILDLKPKHYFTSFTLNTTYGINLLLNQFRAGVARKIVVSEIEHNSPFLSSIVFANKHQIPREIVTREVDGAINPETTDWTKALVVVNVASNIDGRSLNNLADLTKAIHKAGGWLILDAAQAMAHHHHLLRKTTADAICFSAHKMYAPSLGVMVTRRDFLQYLEPTFLGGGMVDDVDNDHFMLSADNPDHLHTRFEPGLQAWGEIVAFGVALKWLQDLPPSAWQNLQKNSEKLHDFIANHPKFHTPHNTAPTPTIACYVDGVDAHLLGTALSQQGMMTRTGYFCVHHYLDHVRHLPPLIRFSLGLHTRSADIETLISALEKL